MTDLTKMSWKSLAEYHCYAKMRKAELVKKWRKEARTSDKFAHTLLNNLVNANEKLKELKDIISVAYSRINDLDFKNWELESKCDIRLHNLNKQRNLTRTWQLIALIFLGGFLYLVIWK